MALDAKPVRKPCCASWAEAHEAGTDDEVYASRVRYDRSGDAVIGGREIELPPVRFCPWCGDPKGAPAATSSDDRSDDVASFIKAAVRVPDAVLEDLKFTEVNADGFSFNITTPLPDVKWKDQR